MNNRWTKEEESKLLKLIASGKTYGELSGGFNRSDNALEMRVKKIIYENITGGGKTPSKISELLNMGSDKVMQYYYSYKEHLERENKNNMEGGSINKFTQLENINLPNHNGGIQNNGNHNGGNINQNKTDKIDKLRLQNEKLKLLLENYILKDKLSKVMKSDKNIQNDILKALLDK